jgi:hypothetical protein
MRVVRESCSPKCLELSAELSYLGYILGYIRHATPAAIAPMWRLLLLKLSKQHW